MQNHYEDGWFYGYSPKEELEFVSDEEHRVRHVDSKNVVGRFVDGEKLDGEASRTARKAVMRKVTLLEARNLRTAHGSGTDVSVQEIRFDFDFRDKSVNAVKRFPEAWAAYQAVRKAAVGADEIEALTEAGLFVEVPKAKARKPRAKKADNVVELKAASA